LNQIYTPAARALPRFAELMGAVQRNCDVSDARHAGDYGLCTFLLKMREYYRWESELPFARPLAKDALGEWLDGRERMWSGLEEADYEPLPLGRSGLDPFRATAANRALVPRGIVYSAGYGRYGKPVFFLGRLLRIEERAGLRVVVSSCEYARELAAPPAMLLGRTIFVRRESVRRYLWERLEEWRWRKLDLAASRALEGCDFETDTEAALDRLADREIETMILHEVGEARAGRLLGPRWRGLMADIARTPAEPVARAVRDLLADCLTTLPTLIGRDAPALHFYFATFDAPRRQLFPEAVEAYGRLAREGDGAALARVLAQGRRRWLETARGWLALEGDERQQAICALIAGGGGGA
jgi:hypothetical protein